MIKSVKPDKIRSPWKMFKASYKAYAKNWKTFVLLLALIAVPSNLLSLVPALHTDEFITSYLSFAAIIMNVALVWAIARLHEEGKVPSVGRSYYDGSALLVRFLLVVMMIVLILVPAALGLIVIGTTILSASQGSGTTPELALLSLIGLVLAIPTFWMLVRYILGIVAAARDDLRPVSAMKAARLLTLGYFWPVAARLVMLVFFLLLISIPGSLVSALLAYLRLDVLSLLVLQLAITFTALPIANLYLFELYLDLEKRFSAKHPETVNMADDSSVAEAEADQLATDEAPTETAAEPTKLSTRRLDALRARPTLRNQAAFGEHIGRRK